MRVGRSRVGMILPAMVLLGALVFSAYSNTFNSPPVLDDIHSFIDEPAVHNFNWTVSAVIALAKTKFGVSRFLPMLSLAVDQWRGGGALSAFHATNLVIHLLCGLAVFFWSLSIFSIVAEKAGRTVKNSEIFAAIAISGFWALNPVQTNAVTYLVQRMASMAALFYLLAFTAYITGRCRWLANRRKAAMTWWIITVFFSVASMLCKQNAAMLPITIVVAELLFCQPDLKKLLGGHKIIATIIIGSGMAIALLVLYRYTDAYGLRRFDMTERLLTESRVVVAYLGLLLLPLPSFLCLDRHVMVSHSLWQPPTTFFSIFLLIGIACLGFYFRKRQPLLSFGLAWFFLNLIIESTVIPLELMFEHRLYLPSAGFYLFAVTAMLILWERYFQQVDWRLPVAVMAIVCAMLSSMTYIRNLDWADAITINADCVKKSPLKPRVYNNLSKAYYLAGKYRLAAENAKKALDLGIYGYEEYWAAACNLVSSLNKLGLKEKAWEKGRDLIRNAPGGAKVNALPIFLCNQAELDLHFKDYKAAFANLKDALDLLERSKMPYMQIVEDKLCKLFDKVRTEGDDSDLRLLGLFSRAPSATYLRLASLYEEYYDYPRVQRLASKALAIDSDCQQCRDLVEEVALTIRENRYQQRKYGTLKHKYVYNFWKSKFNFYLATAYMVEKYHLPFRQVLVTCLERARVLEPTSADPYLLFSWHYFRAGDRVKAIKLIRKGIALQSDYAQLWVNLGMYQLADRQYTAARQSLLKAISLYPGYPKRSQVVAMLERAEKNIM